LACAEKALAELYACRAVVASARASLAI
jgi:hypothetical protein